ncbi:hypothetical protein KUTeg_003737 [Tegillarca granosa]|uniref:Uncharacterized protein n=1 Tax=Tegillarca granosa TaxID=220873 RepID=A0ABQ9FPL6_TEGGR|nr:hypothetical protein KUTeg_003737 [Tegillarca granosa]
MTALFSYIVVYIFCQIKIMFLFLKAYNSKSVLKRNSNLGDWFYDLKFAGSCMAYTNSALNPVIYAGFNENFKQGKRQYFTSFFTF